MPADSTMVSFAQNREDVVLWRALRAVQNGRYLDVGANQPATDSVSRTFYDRGWRGIAVEPVPSLAEAFLAERPNDIVVQAAITDADTEEITLHAVANAGLSTIVDDVAHRHSGYGLPVQDIVVPVRRLDRLLEDAGWDGSDIHFAVIDVEGAEASVLRTFDLPRWRPWILVIEATAPRELRQTHQEWEEQVVDAGYTFCLFDGLSRYYASPDHPELIPYLSYPACSLDEFEPLIQMQHRDELALKDAELAGKDAELAAKDGQIAQLETLADELRSEIVRWRTAALTRWAEAQLGGAPHFDALQVGHLEHELAAMRQTVSWRVTEPLRTVRRWTRP